jgi:hypothetical protein
MSFGGRRIVRDAAVLILGASLAGAPAASAQDAGARIRVGGFGSVTYGRTDENRYGSGAPVGDYTNVNFAVVLSSAVSDRLSVSALVAWNQTGSTQFTKFEYGFATWRLSSSVDLRVGKVKHPGALYSEVFDVGVVRPFLSLPQSVYSESGLAFDNYDGIGLTGRTFTGSWGIGFAAYGGGGSYAYSSPRLTLSSLQSGEGPAGTVIPVRDLVGARITLQPPVHGLTIGVSGARATAETGTGIVGDLHVTTLGAQAEYVTDRLWLRSEIAELASEPTLRVVGYYAEAAWFLTPAWQVAVQGGRLKDTFDDNTGVPPDLDRHVERALGLNYWLSPQLVLKLSHHWVTGNRLAHPGSSADLAQAVATGALMPRTRLLQVGGQFSF